MFTSAFFRAYQRATIEAGIRITMAIVVMIASIVTVLISTDLFNLLMVRLFVAIGIFLLSIYQIVTMLKPNLRGVHKDIDIVAYIQKGWPFAVFIFFTAIYVSIDIVMLSLMVGDKATGFYSVATKIIIFFILIPTGIGNAVMPAMSEKVKSDFNGFLSLAHSATRYVLILSMLAVMFNMFLGQEIIRLLFGKEYAPSGLILMLLSWSLIPSYLNHIWNAMLLSFNKEKNIIIFAAIGAASNISLNLILIPKYTYYGAALATILLILYTFPILHSRKAPNC
jgi:O-antigen/teichoic acid export membrane protein